MTVINQCLEKQVGVWEHNKEVLGSIGTNDVFDLNDNYGVCL